MVLFAETSSKVALVPSAPPADPVANVPGHDEHGGLHGFLAFLAVRGGPRLAALLLVVEDGLAALLVVGGHAGDHLHVLGVRSVRGVEQAETWVFEKRVFGGRGG